MIRFLMLIAGVALGYLFLSGWPTVLGEFVRTFLAVLAIIAGTGLWAARVPVKRRPDGPVRVLGRRPSVGEWFIIICGILAFECGVSWWLTVSPRPLENIAAGFGWSWSDWRAGPSEDRKSAATSVPSPAAGGNWLWTGSFDRPLPQQTNFRPGNKPEVFIRLLDPDDATALVEDRLYVRAFALDEYRDQAWTLAENGSERLRADVLGSVELEARDFGRPIAHQIFHGKNLDGQDVLTAIQGATRVEIPELTRDGDGMWRLPPTSRISGYDYHAVSRPLRLDDLPEDVSDGMIPGHPQLLGLEGADEYRAALADLAKFVSGEAVGARSKLLAIRNFLRKSYQYSLRTSNPARIDPIENFLFHEARGHCEFFATSAALMARSIGIPARMAYGWAGGSYFEADRTFVLRAREAHAWAEVWLPDFGWIVMDATPGDGETAAATLIAPAGAKLPTAADLEPDRPGDGHRSRSPALTDPEAMQISRRMPLGLALVLAALVFLMSVARRLLGWRGDRAKGATSSEFATTVSPGYLREWRMLAAALGLPSHPGATLRAQLAAFPSGLARPDFAAELLDYHYQTRYGKAQRDPRHERNLRKRIRAYRGALDARVAA